MTLNKSFSSRTVGPKVTKLGTKHLWVMGFQVCSNKRSCPFPWGNKSNFQPTCLYDHSFAAACLLLGNVTQVSMWPMDLLVSFQWEMVNLDNALDQLRTISCTNEASGASGPTNVEDQEEDQDGSLPPGWEVRTHQPTGKKYYINHNTRKTQWDPPQRFVQALILPFHPANTQFGFLQALPSELYI